MINKLKNEIKNKGILHDSLHDFKLSLFFIFIIYNILR